MAKKVGMLTFHNAINYGAILQAYALQYSIIKMGYDAEIIDYVWNNKKIQNVVLNDSSLKSKIKKMLIKIYNFIGSFLLKNNNKKKEKLFNEFRKEFIKISKDTYHEKDFCNKNFCYNAFVTGSDQVWNPYRYDINIYGLSFVDKNINTISYAASMGLAVIPKDKEKIMYDALKNVKHVSCREYNGSVSLSKLLGRNVETVLDPTLLLNVDDWSKIVDDSKINKKYVLCYFLGTQNYHRQVAYNIAEKNNYELIIIPTSVRDYFCKGTKVKCCGPKEFIKLFLNASFVCTDSFHGTAFSVNFNKPFYTFAKRDFKDLTSTSARINDFLGLLELSDRLLTPESNIDYGVAEINYDKVNKIVERERKKSLDFLLSSLNDK